MFPIGTVINGNYQILAPLGEGGMGAVFKAFEERQSRIVALKFLHRDFAKDPTGVRRFMQEGEILATVRHPFIVEVFSLETDSETQLPFLIMEFFAGKCLSDFKADFAQEPLRLIKVFLELLDGVKAFHAKNIIHRDLKPANIMINTAGDLKIVDFGIAKGARKQTRTGIAIGTPQYMSPEQCEGKPNITGKSDVYSLGAVLWEMLAGSPPFDAEEDSSDPFLAIILKHLTTPVPLEKLSKTQYGYLFSDILGRMLEKNPRDRPEVEAVIKALETLRARLVSRVDTGIMRFSLERLVQRGPFGEFHLASDHKNDSSVLLQMLPDPVSFSEEDAQARFVRLRNIRSPYVCEILQKGLDQNSKLHFLTMEPPGGVPFGVVKETLINDRDALSKFMLRLLEGLAAIQEQGEIHGNLSPATIGFTREGEPRISGFPMVPRPVKGSPQPPSTIDGYWAPELWTGEAERTLAADVFSAGLIFWEILFGGVPDKLRLGSGANGESPARKPDATVTMQALSPKDPLFPFFESLCRMVRKDPLERPTIDSLIAKLREIRRDNVFPSQGAGSKESLQILILTRDETLATLLAVTLKEFGFRYRRGSSIEDISRLSAVDPTIAWFLDLDGLRNPVPEITRHALKHAPDAKVVFFASAFTREMVENCLAMQATALLVKPLVVPRLVQTLNSLSEEPELLENESLFPSRTHHPESRSFPSEGHQLHVLFFECCVCRERFGNVQFKPGSFELHGTESDFCPICTKGTIPELYSVVVCPACLFADFAGRFQRPSFSEQSKAAFLAPERLESRLKIAQDLDFQSERGLKEGLKSYELAAMAIRELQPLEYDKLASALFLKGSWMCRRMERTLAETDFQTRTLECLMRLYNPYHLVNGRFPEWGTVRERVKPGQELLKERAILVTGFLGGELSARLGLEGQAEFYFDQVFRLPFFAGFPLLARHIQAAFQDFRKRKK